MAEESKLFHESWYRIAAQRISLRASVRVRRQLYRGSRWYVLHDPFSSEFFRLRPVAYGFVSRLSPFKTVEAAWNEVIEADPENAPGQEEVIQLLAQLYYANLLHYDLPPDSVKLFERYREQKQRATKATLMNIMFFRIPLFDPDGMLRRLSPVIRFAVGPVGVILWLVMVFLGVKVAIENFPQLRVQSEGILAPGNIALLYGALILVKALHELGHAVAVRRFGGEVHTMGLMFLIFNPLPYMDATAAWAFRSKWKRVFVGAAGMIAELFVAACAAIVWANTSSGALHALAYNMMFVASVSTVLFNINPLLRFDGYYILSDLLDIPNLHTQAGMQLRHLVERYAFGYRKSTSPASSASEAFWLALFGVLSGIYRVVVFGSVLLFMADRLLILGMIMAAVSAVAWVLVPTLRLIRYLATDSRLDRTRLRAVSVTFGALLAVFALLYFVPLPSSFKAPGVLEADNHVLLVNDVDGYVGEVLAASGTRVGAGDALLRLENQELALTIRVTEAGLREALAMRQRALQENQADVKPMDSLLTAIGSRLERLREEERNLVVRAKIGGLWIAPGIEDRVGMWLRRGTQLGQLVDDSGFTFVSVVSQRDTSSVFSNQIRSATMKLVGQADKKLTASRLTIIPAEQLSLPSAALGYGAGGGVAVDANDRSGRSAAESFYQVRLPVRAEDGVALLHGRSGQVRFQLPDEPLLRQWWRRLRQLLQSRYQI